PRGAGQAMGGEMGHVWLEQPGVGRAVALLFSERTNAPPSFFRGFARAVDLAPWLHPVTATSLAADHPPRSHDGASLAGRSGPVFSAGYLDELESARP